MNDFHNLYVQISKRGGGRTNILIGRRVNCRTYLNKSSSVLIFFKSLNIHRLDILPLTCFRRKQCPSIVSRGNCDEIALIKVHRYSFNTSVCHSTLSKIKLQNASVCSSCSNEQRSDYL